jgi:hypothetical protein
MENEKQLGKLARLHPSSMAVRCMILNSSLLDFLGLGVGWTKNFEFPTQLISANVHYF